MPIENNSSYIPTMNEFRAHWEDVDGVLDNPMIVQGPNDSAITLAVFTTMRNNLQAQFMNVVDALGDQVIARTSVRLKKEELLPYLAEFNGLLDSYYTRTDFADARPKPPSMGDHALTFLTAMREVATLWSKMNAASAPAGITLPLELADGTTQAEFASLLPDLDAAYAAYDNASQDVVVARSARERLKLEAYTTMKNYRTTAKTRCVQQPDLLDTIPDLSPRPGHTPDPVNASAVFVAPNTAHVEYEASTDPDLQRYELRGNPGPDYDREDSVVIATNQPVDPLVFDTNFSLNQPGAQVTFKVYTVLNTGNEAGSAGMTVQRPF